jgi:serine kinase of HPr protein (carbohydrate metabolism regulator)
MILHAGLMAQWQGGGWSGVLIEGPSGCGKSDLALRLLDQGFRLVADDRVIVWRAGGRLFGRAPETLHGLIEARGWRIAREAALPLARIDLVLWPGAPERLPEPDFIERLQVRLPRLTLPYLEVSAPAKLRRAMAALYLPDQRRM